MATTTAATLAAVRRRGINKAQASRPSAADQTLDAMRANAETSVDQARQDTLAQPAVQPGGMRIDAAGLQDYAQRTMDAQTAESQTGPSPTGGDFQPGTGGTGATGKPIVPQAQTAEQVNEAAPVSATPNADAARAALAADGPKQGPAWFAGTPLAGVAQGVHDFFNPDANSIPDQQEAAADAEALEQREADGVPTSQSLLGGVVAASDNVATTGEADAEGAQTTADDNTARNRLTGEGMVRGQDANLARLGAANTMVAEGDLETQSLIEQTRTDLNNLPGAVQTAFDDNKGDLDDAIVAGRAGIETREADALGRALEGRSGAMDAAVASIHGSLRGQMSAIDAQVQQGTLSPSQAAAMKAKIQMGGTMQLSAAIGQTTLAFNKLEADVATSFGNMFTTFETNVTNAEGQYGSNAAAAVGQANIARSELNNALTDMSAQSRQARDAAISNNLATRSTFVTNKDTHNMAMIDHENDEYILTQPFAINAYTSAADTFSAVAKDEHARALMEFMYENAEQSARNDQTNIVYSFLTQFGGPILGALGLG